MLPIPSIPGNPADPVGAYKHLLALSLTTSSNQPLLTFTSHSGMVTVTVWMLANACCVMLQELGLDSTLYSLHSLKRGWATVAYRAGAEQMQIKWHKLWSSDNFENYVASTCIQTSPVGSALAGSMAAA